MRVRAVMAVASGLLIAVLAIGVHAVFVMHAHATHIGMVNTRLSLFHRQVEIHTGKGTLQW